MTSWSDTQIVLTVPANVIAGTLKMQNGNAAESNGIAYTIVPPVLTSISPTSIATGMQVTLTGVRVWGVEGPVSGRCFSAARKRPR